MIIFARSALLSFTLSLLLQLYVINAQLQPSVKEDLV